MHTSNTNIHALPAHTHAYLRRLHVEDLGDPALHDQEVRVVHIQLNRSEQVLHSRGHSIAAIDQVLVATSYHNLSTRQVLGKVRKMHTTIPYF